MKTHMTINFLIAIICYVILGYEFLYNMSIMNTSYMYFLIMFLFGFGGYQLGIGIGKLIIELKK